ncbi:MAG: UvrD-helicase domain-containing protein [Persephonella sp.]|nr:UvrD-helicase domain-containing protein [Persephonella sp.]
MDFDDLLINVVKLFKEHPEIRKSWQDRFDYVLVDEYQDTNLVQHEILKLIVGNRDCITVVGDPQQCIYTWRGANPDNILEFERLS